MSIQRSERSHPRFDFNLQQPQPQYTFNPQALQVSHEVPQQWMQPGPRSVQHNMPSPATSVRSAVTSPLERSFDQSSFHQNNVPSIDSRIDPSLLNDMLAPTRHMPRMSYNAMERSYHEESWNPYHLRTSNVSDEKMQRIHNNANFGLFRTGPESICSAANVSDSGFYSQSVVSHDACRADQSGVPSPLDQQVENLNIHLVSNEAPGAVRIPSDQRSHISDLSRPGEKQGNQLKCQICGEISKCKSDFK